MRARIMGRFAKRKNIWLRLPRRRASAHDQMQPSSPPAEARHADGSAAIGVADDATAPPATEGWVPKTAKPSPGENAPRSASQIVPDGPAGQMGLAHAAGDGKAPAAPAVAA